MTGVRAMIAVVLAGISFVFVSGSAEAQSEMTWRFQSDYKYKAQVKLFSSDRKGHVWPSSTQVWPLNDSEIHSMKITCLGGEKICYGGWVTGNAKLYWGVGADGKQGCQNCCFTCNGGQTPIMHLK